MVKAALGGAGVPTYGAVPDYQPQPEINGTSLADTSANQAAYPYSISAAMSSLKSHGWSVTAGGTDRCTSPGTGPTQCGAGIKAGQPLSFNFEYPTGVVQEAVEAQLLQGDAKKAGITISLSPVPDSVAFSRTVCTKGQ